VYPQWGWTTEDAERALASLRRFGSTTVLNGHIHQVLRKVEGNISFHTAMSTAFRSGAGHCARAGAMKVPEEQARRMLGCHGSGVRARQASARGGRLDTRVRASLPERHRAKRGPMML